MWSQFGEDEKVAEILSHDGVLPTTGTLLEIGAWSVKDFSNSRLFIDAGWNAVLVEFSPGPVHALVKEYGYNDRVQIIQAAITPGPQHVFQFEVTDDALSSNDPEQVAKWRNMSSAGREGDYAGGFYGKLWVPTLSIASLLDQFFGTRHIEYASIDTEGSSVPIAVALMETDHRPRVVVVEHDNNIAYLQEQAQRWGYRTAWTNSTNVILERR